MKLMHSIMPEMVSEPLAWGEYKEEPGIYFFICSFVEMSGDIPDVSVFPTLVADMHKRGISPTGDFGNYGLRDV
jgi:protein-ribulosamine 3-kinase